MQSVLDHGNIHKERVLNTGLREVIIGSVFRGLQMTSQAASQSELVCRSVLRSWDD